MDCAKSCRLHRAYSAAALPVGCESCCVARFCSAFNASVKYRAKRLLHLSAAKMHIKLQFILEPNDYGLEYSHATYFSVYYL